MSPNHLILSCSVLAGPVLAAQQPTPRTVAVVTQFGGTTDQPANELLRVHSVLRLADGRFVVSNGKPLEIRVYRPSGELEARLGREGSGPGEYRHAARARPWTGDSVVLLSSGTRQWLLYTLDGTFVRQWEVTRDEYDVVEGWGLSGGAVVRRGVVGSAGCSSALIRRLVPVSAPALHEAMTDDLGRVWLRPYGTSRWTVHGANGSVIARLDLPPRFRATQFDGGLLIGVREDDDGFDHVVTLRHDLAAVGRVTSPECTNTPSGVDPVLAAKVKTGMRNAMTAAEAYYADHGHYPANADGYPKGTAPSGSDLRVLDGDEDSFALSIVDRATGYLCIVNVGSGTELDGMLLCGR
jgi:hypothetical protein